MASVVDGDQVPPQKRRQVAVFEASKALIAYITPGADEIGKVCHPSLHYTARTSSFTLCCQ
jgi:hypothetical protein